MFRQRGGLAALFALLTFSIVISGIRDFVLQNWASLAMSLLAILFLCLPFWIEKHLKVAIPREFIIVLLLFFYAAVFLGTARHFYARFWWWDNMAHGFSGLIFGNIGFLLAMFLNKRYRLNLQGCPFLIALFAFCFAVASGGVWEIYEFSMDEIFGLLYQGVGITDTMTDIIFDTSGALIFAFVAYFQEKGTIRPFFRNLAKEDAEDIGEDY